MSGTGLLTKSGAGTLTLTGANTYTGGTTVSAGTLQGNTTSLQGNIANNAAVVFDQVAAGTYAGVLSGTGSLTKTQCRHADFDRASTPTRRNKFQRRHVAVASDAQLGTGNADVQWWRAANAPPRSLGQDTSACWASARSIPMASPPTSAVRSAAPAHW